MRTTVLISSIILTLCGTLFAYPSNGQLLSKKVSIHHPSEKLSELISELEKQNIPLVYDANKINLKNAKTAAKAFHNNYLKEVLDFSLKNNNIAYKEMDGYILLEKKVAQEQGRLAGKIIDERGNPLVKASIRVQGSNQAVQSSVDGSYALNLPAGTYKIQVSYVSHQTQIISDVQINAGSLTNLNVSMKASSSTIETVTVTTTFKKASVAGLYAAQKNAATVTDGISAEQIARTPDNNMGQVLKRITGLTTLDNRLVVIRGMSDRYNQAQLDGVNLPSTSQNRRDFAFDIIPTDMISSVVVNKTASPDISSEFSGGQVSINTLDIPDANFTSIQIGSGGNSQTLGKDFYRLGERKSAESFGFYDKTAKYPDNILPWQWHSEATASFFIPMGEKTDPKVKDMPLSLERPDLKYGSLDAIAQSKKFNSDAMKFYQLKGRPNQNMRFALGRVYELNNNLKFGFSASGNFRNEENITRYNNVRGSQAFNTGSPERWMDSTKMGQNGPGTSFKFNSSSGAMANLGLQGNNFKIALKNMYAKTYSNNFNQATRLPYRDLSDLAYKEYYQLPEALSLQQHQLVGDYLMPWNIKADAMFAVNKIKQEILDERKLKYNLTTKIDDNYYFQTPGLLTTAGWSNLITKLDTRMWTAINETDYNWAVNFSKSNDFGEHFSNLIKIGYQGWYKSRDLWVSRILPMTRSWDINNPNNSEAAPVIMKTYDKLFEDGGIGNGNYQAIYYPDRTGGNIYDGTAETHAAYLMLDQKLFNFIRLVYGVRLEHYNLSNRQDEYLERLFGAEEAIKPKYDYMRTVGEKNLRWLPSFNATFSITNNFNIRAAYSKTAIRPDFRESSHFAFYDFELDASVGGENVVTTLIDNADLRFEWYPSPGEIISLTGYFKYLDKPIELVSKDYRDDVFVFANMESAKNMGIEAEIRKNFSFINESPFFSNLFVHANYTYLKSKVTVLGPWDFTNPEPGVTIRTQARYSWQDRPLLGQSPWIINLGLGYWAESFGVTASYNHRGYRTFATNVSQTLVQYELAPRQVDFQIYARFLKKKLEAKINMANLLNDWTQYYRNDLFYPDHYVKSQIESGNPNPRKGNNEYNKADNDVILYRKQDGRRFGVSLTYNF